MKTHLFGWLMAAAVVMAAAGCSTVPYTGRSQLLLYSQDEENKMGTEAWAEIKKSVKQSSDRAKQEQVKRVAGRLVAAAHAGSAWEFAVFESAEANAFALPGGRVAVYTGLFKYIDSDDALAVVLSHEIAHVVARHGNEGMSQNAAAGAVLSIGSDAVGAAGGDAAAAKVASIFGALGMQYGLLLPYSRAHEAEADEIGIILMYKAGYNIDAAVPFWKRFAAAGSSVPAFFSTHPSGASRIEAIGREVAAIKSGAYAEKIGGK